MSDISVSTLLACGYAVLLVCCAYGIDALAKRASRSSRATATSGFSYHEDHDAWLCPQDQWLWPTTFDPEHRVMRYRGTPSVCNACPVKDSCTHSSSGREIVRAVDAWPASEAARFHRGIACAVVVMAVIWPTGMAVSQPIGIETALLLGVSFAVSLAGLPLFSHLRRSPASFPDGVQLATNDESVAARAKVALAEHRRRTGYRSSTTPKG